MEAGEGQKKEEEEEEEEVPFYSARVLSPR